MRKVLTCVLIVLVLCTLLTGCVQCISTETSTVQVKIVDKKYCTGSAVPVYGGVIRRPAIYQIIVEYNGEMHNISGQSTYRKYANQVGKMANATLETRKYDDGTVRYDVVNLE